MPKHTEYKGKRRNRRTTVDSPLVPVHTCEHCGKQAYVSRADARFRTKRLHQGKKPRLYECSDGNRQAYWHVTTAGSHVTAAWKDYETSGRKPSAEWHGK